MGADIETRLRNWGAWSRSSSGVAAHAASVLYHLMVEAASVQVEPRTASVIDEEDALKVDRAICRAGLRPYELKIIKHRYIWHMEKRAICLRERLRFRDFEKFLDEIRGKVANQLI